MKQMRSMIFIIIFFTVSLMPLAAMSFHTNPDSNENRVLQDMPKIKYGGQLNKNYFSQMTDFFSDNFAYRVELVQLNELLYTSVLKYSTNEKVIYGKDGWLYFNETINDYVGKTDMSDSKIKRLVTVLSLENEYLNSLGIKYIFTVAPNKNTVYPEYMPDRYVKTNSPTVLEKLSDNLKKCGVQYCDFTTAIRNAKDYDSILYYKSDSHWNDLGARVAYNCLMKDIKSFLPSFVYDDLNNLAAVETTTIGDLEKMLFPMRAGSAEGRTTLNLTRLYTTQRPFLTVEDANIITTSNVNSYSIMMFRDSFGNTIIPFISNNFGYAYYSKEFPVTFKELDKHNPNVVVHEIAQRNIPKLIEKAPIMHALERQIAFPNSINTGGKMFAETIGDLIHVYGYLDYDSSRAYRCYITYNNGKTFEAFPVLEAEKMAGDIPKIQKAVGFSLYLDKSDFTNDGSIVAIDFGDNTISHTFSTGEVNK